MGPFCYNTFQTDCNYAFHHRYLTDWILDCILEKRNGTCPCCRKVLAEVEHGQSQAVLLELEPSQSPQGELEFVTGLMRDPGLLSHPLHLFSREDVDQALEQRLEEMIIDGVVRLRANVRGYMERHEREVVGDTRWALETIL
jgi:hypothetical protein